MHAYCVCVGVCVSCVRECMHVLCTCRCVQIQVRTVHFQVPDVRVHRERVRRPQVLLGLSWARKPDPRPRRLLTLTRTCYCVFSRRHRCPLCGPITHTVGCFSDVPTSGLEPSGRAQGPPEPSRPHPTPEQALQTGWCPGCPPARPPTQTPEPSLALP